MVRDRTFNATEILSVEASNLTDTFQNLGAALVSPLYMMTIKNTTDAIVYISEDGATKHYQLAPGESEMYDFQTNKAGSLGLKRVGLQFTVKIDSGVSPTGGCVILQGQTL